MFKSNSEMWHDLETADLLEDFALRTGGTGKVGEMGPKIFSFRTLYGLFCFFFSWGEEQVGLKYITFTVIWCDLIFFILLLGCRTPFWGRWWWCCYWTVMRNIIGNEGLGKFWKTETPRPKSLDLIEQEFRLFQHDLHILLVYIITYTSLYFNSPGNDCYSISIWIMYMKTVENESSMAQELRSWILESGRQIKTNSTTHHWCLLGQAS